MTNHVKIPSKIRYESFLIGVLYLIGALSLYHDVTRRGRPYVYPTILVLQLFIIKSWMRIPSNNTLHYFLSLDTSQNRKIRSVCGLHTLPDRRTFDRRFKVLPLSEMIANMGGVFLSEGLVENTTASLDSSPFAFEYPHLASVSIPDIGMRLFFMSDLCHTGPLALIRWVFGYKLHMICSTRKLIVPLSADLTTANIADNQVYHSLVDSLAGLIDNIIADPAYDDGKLYLYSAQHNMRPVCPIKAI
jgi:hypothetical protein